MSKAFYPKLAASNIKKNSQTYFPYILTCIGTIMMFYIMSALSKNTGLDQMSGGEQMRMILNLGTWVIGICAFIFLFYTNSFLIKRRKKELGLYNILGMEKKHIAKVLFMELLYVALISLILGVLGGVLLSKLIFLLLLKILHFSVPIVFIVPAQSIVTTLILFCVIYTLTLLNNLRQIHLANPIELVRGGREGEREPKTNWLLAVIGILCLGGGYFISLTTKSPLNALMLFFVAVILVIIGTYALFTAVSIIVLKALKKNRKFYYKTKHFTSVSGMIYRMKQNAAGLANICILSTAILVTVSTTVCLYTGMEDVLRTRYPRNILVIGQNLSADEAEKVKNTVDDEVRENGIEKDGECYYRYVSLAAVQEGSTFVGEAGNPYLSGDYCSLVAIPLEEYNRLEGKETSLQPDEILFNVIRGDMDSDRVNIFGKEFKVKEKIEDIEIDGSYSAAMMNNYCIVVANEQVAKDLYNLQGNENFTAEDLSLYLGFDTKNSPEQQVELVKDIGTRLENLQLNGYARSEGSEASKEDFYSLYGGLFFLGIFLGVLFLMATVLIIYYKQISEGFDDKERFEIMQKVGMSKKEVKKSIHSQVIMVFFLPLVTAVIHICFAFPVIQKILSVLNMTNIPLFIASTAVTVLVFAVFYATVYMMTAKVYYRIVK